MSLLIKYIQTTTQKLHAQKGQPLLYVFFQGRPPPLPPTKGKRAGKKTKHTTKPTPPTPEHHHHQHQHQQQQGAPTKDQQQLRIRPKRPRKDATPEDDCRIE
mmetsp:Transcript_5442/g.15090  ORF Transcript_5442/g.15090 Transcript_5442/m.15090 type:complete len:102 (-) Transcript_5442:271-576(-)